MNNKDLISRQAAINLASELVIPGEEFHQYNQAIWNYCAELVKLAEVLATTNDDMISRKMAIDEIDREETRHGSYGTASWVGCDWSKKVVAKLPPVVSEENCDDCKYGYFGSDKCDHCRVGYPSYYERSNDDKR